MKKIKTLIIVLISTISLSAQSRYIQTDTLITYHPLKTHSLNLTQLLVRELRLTYTHSLSQSFGLAYNVGFRFQKNNARPEVYSGAGLTYLTTPLLGNKHYNGAYLSIMPRFRFLKQRGFLLATEFYNHLLWFNNRHFSYKNVESRDDEFDAQRSERINTSGINLLCELQIGNHVKITKKSGFYISTYGSIGAYYKTYKFQSSNGTWRNEPIVGVKEESGHVLYPTIHLGIKSNFYFNLK
jgi:hypothetical protein